jgi:imidazolonepropionase-like amidohydrolase
LTEGVIGVRKVWAAAVLVLACQALAAPALWAEPVKKEDLMTAPAGARHFTISSSGGKHGDIWSWTLPDRRIAYRMSMNLRGWITETDQTIALGPDGQPMTLAIRGFTDTGDATENFYVDKDGVAHWKTAVDEGSAPLGTKRYATYGGPWLAGEQDFASLIAAGDKGLDLLPSGHASISIGQVVDIEGPDGPKAVKLAFTRGFGFTPSPVWLDADNRFFGFVGGMALLPEGYEGTREKLKRIQDDATAAMIKEVSQTFLNPRNKTATLVNNVQMFDSLAGAYLADRAVLIADGKVSQVGSAGSLRAPAGATVIDGRGKTLLPGLWDAHRHTGGADWNLIQNLATGMTNFRSPGSEISETLDMMKARDAGELLAPEGKVTVIIDRKDPLAAQGALTVSSLEETLAAVRTVKKAGLWGVKFYTSMNPQWIAPAAAEAHRLGLHVHGHIPAGMRPIEAVRAGYDEITHINFIMMQAMPQEVVDKSNTAARLEGPAKYGKDVDLDSPEMTAFYAELAKRGTYIDPTLTVWEPLMTSDGSALPPEYAPFAKVAPPGVVRGWKIAGYPLFDGLTRADFQKSFDKMIALVGRLHKAGAPIVAGTDGYGLELVRELELYQQAGMSNPEALQSATIVPARLTGMDKEFGSITPGKVANLILVDGDVSQDLANLHRVETVFLDGYRLDADKLREASGLTGMPQ